uniref:Uncharacterized protein n=1 Tax=Arundo donax TaxID=35708 RepID=A0A0A9G448_ARUDO
MALDMIDGLWYRQEEACQERISFFPAI